jgi:hypothetical protein
VADLQAFMEVRAAESLQLMLDQCLQGSGTEERPVVNRL